MVGMSTTIDGPDLATAILDKQAAVPTYVLYPADATDPALKTTWIRFEKGGCVLVSELR